MKMIRIPSFKCLLLLLMIVVVGLTLGFISKCTTSSSPPSPAAFQIDHNNRRTNKEPPGFNYYQSINDEDEEAAAAEVNNLKRGNHHHHPSSRGANKGNLISSNKLLSGGLDYPFDEEGGGGGSDGLLDTKNKGKTKTNDGDGGVVDITCNINNGKYKIDCKKDSAGSEVYIPFSFIHKYFEIYGKLEEATKEGEEQSFTWLHSFAKIYRPTLPYNPKGIFTYFENYNVEVRDRVKCISGAQGVPVSTQWDVNGYFYPIQIAQFGLSHFSKFLTEGEPKRIVLDDGDETRGGWIPSELVTTLPNDNNDPSTNHYVQIQSPSSGDLHVKLDVGVSKPRMLMLSWQMRIISNSQDGEMKPNNLTFTATVRYESQVYHLHYVAEDFLIQGKDNHIYHGLGNRSTTTWQLIIRDLGVDLQKGINTMSQKVKKSKILKILKSKVQLESISITSLPGKTLILLDNMTLSTNEHLAQFYQAADWFVAHQDGKGGWPIPVKRKFGSDFYPVLESGWYSAMGQGHALSLLARAYTVTTNNSHYGEACAKAVSTIFDHPGTEGGVRGVFMDKFIWYEEYPTTPSSFVLNGFMYALLGLYDVKALSVLGAGDKAELLYDEGLISLKTMLPLYDTGSGTFYDLRHYTVPGISPNLARLDYHVTHINQLLTFATFETDPIFKMIAERWIGYTEGNRAPHN